MYKIMQAYSMSNFIADSGLPTKPGAVTGAQILRMNEEFLENYIQFNFDINYLATVFNMVASRYDEEIIFIIPNSDTRLTNYKKWFKKYINVFLNTSDKYSTLLNAYEDEQENLMKGLKTTQTSAVSSTGSGSVTNSGSDENTNSETHSEDNKDITSDTPQESGSISAMSDLSYASRIDQNKRSLTRSITSRYTKGTSVATQEQATSNNTVATEADNASKIARLAEIKNLYSNLILEWTNEFRGLFIEDLNLTAVEDY